LRETLSNRQETLPWAHESTLGVQPLPLAAARERDRGFNQSTIIADIITPTWHTNAHPESSLARISSGTPQANIEDHSLRSANVTGDFIALDRMNHAVLLVDDVVTTGSTSADAARALLGAGVLRVYLFALALGA
jgi:predicted amidophosphoribosyltransferase